MDFITLKEGFGLVKMAIDLVKQGKDLLPGSDKDSSISGILNEAEDKIKLAEAQIAKGLNYNLCQCSFPPNIMLSVGYNEFGEEKYECPNCKKTLPPPSVNLQATISDY